MKKRETKQFTARYKRIMVITFLVVLLISAAILGIQINEKGRHEDRQLVELFKTRCLAIDNLVVSIGEHVELLQIRAESFFLEKSENSYESILFRALDRTKVDPAYFGLDNIPFPYKKEHVGNLTGFGTISPALKDEMEMALSLNSLFQACKNNIPSSQWIYYTSGNNFINIYPWVNSGEFKFTKDLYSKPFFTMGLSENNPDRELFWTEAYVDEYGAGKMVTAAQSVYRGDLFLGTVAIDVTFERLIEHVQGFHPDGTLIIVNKEKQLIAHPTLASSGDEIKFIKDALQGIIKPDIIPLIDAKLKKYRRKGSIERPVFGSYTFIWYKMIHAPWHIVYIPDKENLFLKYLFIKEGIILTFITLIIALTLMLSITLRMTWREFIYPSEKLVLHINNENNNTPVEIPHRIPTPWYPWFNAISKAYEENRSLIRMLRDDKKRYMPNYVLVASMSKDCGSTTIGNYIAHSFVSSGEKNKKKLYMEYPFNRKLHLEFNTKEDQHVYLHPNGYDIWLSYDLSVFPEEVKTSLLMNEIIKSYSHIVVNTPIWGGMDANTKSLMEQAQVIVLMVPPDDSGQELVETALKQIRGIICQQETYVYTRLNRLRKEHGHERGASPGENGHGDKQKTYFSIITI